MYDYKESINTVFLNLKKSFITSTQEHSRIISKNQIFEVIYFLHRACNYLFITEKMLKCFMFQVFIWLIQEHAKILSLRKAKNKSQKPTISTLHFT